MSSSPIYPKTPIYPETQGTQQGDPVQRHIDSAADPQGSGVSLEGVGAPNDSAPDVEGQGFRAALSFSEQVEGTSAQVEGASAQVEEAGVDLGSEQAIRAFQQSEGLAVTGQVDTSTIQRVETLVQEARMVAAAASGVDRGLAAAVEGRAVDAQSASQALEPSLRGHPGLEQLGEMPVQADLPSGPARTVFERVTRRLVPAHERLTFDLADQANQATESSGRAVFSGLRTTAGPDARASFGLGQLTVQAHLGELTRLTTADLSLLGIQASDINEMRRRGSSAEAWYRVLEGHRKSAAYAETLGLDGSALAEVRSYMKAGDHAALARRFGVQFARGTGLPAHALADLAGNMHLLRADLREAFRVRYKQLHGAAFDPAHRSNAKLAATALELCREVPELAQNLDRLGGPTEGAASLGHYLGVGDTPENLHGWYAAAAQSAVGRERFVGLLQRVDALTTRMRHATNVTRALAAVRGATDLTGINRARVVARLARCFHGAPGRARGFFFVGGDYSRPRFETASAMEEGLGEYRSNRVWSDRRLVQAFDRGLAERGLG